MEFQDCLCYKHIALPMRSSVVFCPLAKLKLTFSPARKNYSAARGVLLVQSVLTAMKRPLPLTSEILQLGRSFLASGRLLRNFRQNVSKELI